MNDIKKKGKAEVKNSFYKDLFSLHLEYYFIHSDIRPLSFPNRL